MKALLGSVPQIYQHRGLALVLTPTSVAPGALRAPVAGRSTDREEVPNPRDQPDHG
jgi:hypothetical protein